MDKVAQLPGSRRRAMTASEMADAMQHMDPCEQRRLADGIMAAGNISRRDIDNIKLADGIHNAWIWLPHFSWNKEPA